MYVLKVYTMTYLGNVMDKLTIATAYLLHVLVYIRGHEIQKEKQLLQCIKKVNVSKYRKSSSHKGFILQNRTYLKEKIRPQRALLGQYLLQNRGQVRQIEPYSLMNPCSLEFRENVVPDKEKNNGF